MRKFLIVIEKANGNYSAYSPDLAGCVAAGETRGEADRNMHEAIKMHVSPHSVIFKQAPKATGKGKETELGL
jgi:predicted RNase H-like HicB family nuclease